MRQDYAAALALSAIEGSGLQRWTFGLDHHPRRISSVRMTRRHITLSTRALARETDEDILRNLTHSIVHAKLGNFDHGRAFVEEFRDTAGYQDPGVVHCEQLQEEYEAVCQCGRLFYRKREPDEPAWFHEECGREAGVLSFV